MPLAIAFGMAALQAGVVLQVQPVLEQPSRAQLSCLQLPAAPSPRIDTTDFFRLRLSFNAPDSAPRIEYLHLGRDAQLREWLERRANEMRLPCLAAGQVATGIQEVEFGPAGARIGDVVAVERGLQDLHCVLPPSERLEIDFAGGPGAPRLQATVLLRMSFEKQFKQQKVDVLYTSGEQELATQASDYAGRYLDACSGPMERPYVLTQLFRTSDVEQGLRSFKPASLVTFLGMVKDLDSQSVHFNLDTMACPFRLRWTLFMPYRPNVVRQLGDTDPNRAALTAWLGALSLNLDKEALDQLLGESMTITVPCGTLDL